MKLVAFGLLAAVLVLTACDAGHHRVPTAVVTAPRVSTTPRVESGLDGVASIAIGCEPTACAALADADLVIYAGAATERRVAEVTTDRSGHFRVALAPGEYTIVGPCGGRECSGPPTNVVTVIAGAFSHIDLRYAP